MANSGEIEFYEARFAEFTEQTGIEVNFLGVGWADYYTRLTTSMHAGNWPDIIYIRASDLILFTRENTIIAIDEYVEAAAQAYFNVSWEQFSGRFFDTAIDLYSFDRSNESFMGGELFAVPKDLSVQQLGFVRDAIYANLPAIRAAGLRPPWEMDFAVENYSWYGFRRMAEIIGASDILCADGGEIFGADLPPLEVLVWANNGQMINLDAGQVNLNSQPVRDAVYYQAQLLAGGGGMSGDGFAHFLSGNLAFYSQVNSWDVGAFNYNLVDSLGLEWDIMPWPAGPTTLTGQMKVGQGHPGTVRESDWHGLITSAGYAMTSRVRRDRRVDAARLLLHLITPTTLNERINAGLTIPMDETLIEYYLTDEAFSPQSRSIFLDVISGDNGRFPSWYWTASRTWEEAHFSSQLAIVHAATGNAAIEAFNNLNWTQIQNFSQFAFDEAHWWR